MIKFISSYDKDIANGMRDTSKRPLTGEEIEFVKSEIRRIGADEHIFIFNDEEHLASSTCYNFNEDKIYVTRNVFPDEKYGSTHPRDLMSVGAVLAHEYYGHKTYRGEYISDMKKRDDYHTIPSWQAECRASITAAKITPNLTDKEKRNLIMDAIYHANEFGHLIEMDDFMKEVIYGYSKSITETMDEARKNFKATYGRLLTEDEAIELTDEIRKAIKKNSKKSETTE